MKNESWQKIETIFHQALDFEGEARQKFLEQICAHDSDLLTEVESLITAYENETEFLENPTLNLSLVVIHESTQKTRTNTKLGSYEIGAKLGSGGMGEVYEATDTKLNRKVALKFLSDSLKNDNVAKRQLYKEAQAIAMLEHPNICAVYGIEEIENANFIVMQLIEGTTLEKGLDILPVSIESFKSIAKQIVSAVAFAHSHGVIHRDIKPGNIMFSSDGNIKVLDFGLAKIIGKQQIFEGEVSRKSSHFSQNGIIIGTISYMSPEQLRGEKLDYQSDIFSIGIILFELMVKRNPFQRKTQAETIAAILNENIVSVKDFVPDLPRNITNLIDKCLKKDKSGRFHSTAEILVELENIKDSIETGFFTKSVSFNKYPASILLVLLLSCLGFLYLNKSTRIPNFAILPIANESNRSEIDYLSEGLTEGLINKFSRFTKLRVKALTIISKYKGQQVDPLAIGKDLNVDAVMTGKLFSRDNLVFFQANLINTADGSQLWGNEYKIDGNDLLIVQDEISTQIASKLDVKLSDEEIQLLNKAQTTSPEAEEHYFQGQYYLNNRSRTNLDKAILNFGKAIDIDPLYAKAWSGLADSYVFKSSPAFGSLTPKDSMIKAKAATAQALKLDNNLSEAHNTLGLIKLKYEWNWQEAESSFLKSIELNPNYAQPHYWYSHLLILKKDFGRAKSEAEIATELDPLSPNSEINIGRIYYYERQSDKAIQIFSQILQSNPTNRGAAYMLGLTYMQKGLYREAASLFEKFYDGDKIYFAAQLGYAYGKLNRKDDAQRVLDELEKISKKEIIPPQEKAIIYLGMNNKDKAFELFKLSCEQRFASFPFILTESFFDGLRSDVQFINLANCVKPIN